MALSTWIEAPLPSVLFSYVLVVLGGRIDKGLVAFIKRRPFKLGLGYRFCDSPQKVNHYLGLYRPRYLFLVRLGFPSSHPHI